MVLFQRGKKFVHQLFNVARHTLILKKLREICKKKKMREKRRKKKNEIMTWSIYGHLIIHYGH